MKQIYILITLFFLSFIANAQNLIVSDACTSSVNGEYELSENINGKVSYVIDNEGDSLDFIISWSGTRWELNDPTGLLGSYNNLDSDIAPSSFSSVWEVERCEITVGYIHEWTGTKFNGEWEDADNWSSNTVPAEGDAVLIPANLFSYPTATADVIVNTIEIADGATFIANGLVNASVTYTKNIENTNWQLLSPPVSGETFEDVITDIGTNIAISASRNLGVALYNNGNATVAWEYAPAATVSGVIADGQGIGVKLASAGDVSFTGSAIVSDVNMAVTTGVVDNFTLLGNPFLANLSSADFLNDNAVTGTGILSDLTLWFWNGTEYQTTNLQSNDVIEPGTGFFIESNINGNILFDYSDVGHRQNAAKSSTSSNKFELAIASADKKTAIKIFYTADKTTGYDNGYDSKMFGGATYDFAVFTELVSDNEGDDLAIQTLPDTYDAVIPVGVIAGAGEELEFSAENLNLPEDVSVYLEDKATGAFTNLSETTYKTILTDAANGTGQFYIHTTEAKSLSTDDIVANTNISIYKSATQTLTVSGLNTTAAITVYSLSGKEVYTTSVKGNGVIDLPNLSGGIYIVSLKSTLGTVTKKVSLN